MKGKNKKKNIPIWIYVGVVFILWTMFIVTVKNNDNEWKAFISYKDTDDGIVVRAINFTACQTVPCDCAWKGCAFYCMECNEKEMMNLT